MNDQSHVYEVLAELAPKATSYLCIGVQEGECLRHVVEANPRLTRLVLCDTWGPHYGGTGRGSHAHIEAMLQRLGFAGAVEWLDGDSKLLIPTVVVPVDLTYVDGDHSTEGALADLQHTWPLTMQHMVVHDTNFPEVQAALDRFLFWTVGKPASVFHVPARQGLAVVSR